MAPKISQFRFELGDPVRIAISGETGKVIARAEYLAASDAQYQVRYKAADGRAVESWWNDEALEAAE